MGQKLQASFWADGLEITTPHFSRWAGNYNPPFEQMGWRLQPYICTDGLETAAPHLG